MVYIQGPASGVDLMVAGLQIFPVDRHARFRYLMMRTDKVTSKPNRCHIVYSHLQISKPCISINRENLKSNDH
jgi:hypothetical protein